MKRFMSALLIAVLTSLVGVASASAAYPPPRPGNSSNGLFNAVCQGGNPQFCDSPSRSGLGGSSGYGSTSRYGSTPTLGGSSGYGSTSRYGSSPSLSNSNSFGNAKKVCPYGRSFCEKAFDLGVI